MTHMKKLFITTLFFLSISITYAQDTLSGVLLDAQTLKPLSYGSIGIVNHHLGTISNENGRFNLILPEGNVYDSVAFSYVGFATYSVPILKILNTDTVLLSPNVQNLEEFFVFSEIPNVKDILKNVLENKNQNYQSSQYIVQDIFTRTRDEMYMRDFALDYKKSTIEGIDEEALQNISNSFPEHSQSFMDAYGTFYSKGDTLNVNNRLIQAVELKEESFTEIEKYAPIFESAFTTESEDEYWKFKTGIIGVEMDMDGDSAQDDDPIQDTGLARMANYAFNSQISYYLSDGKLDNKDIWEFIYSPGKYQYEIVGGVTKDGEKAYMIEFTPKNGGLYQGTLFISMETFAVLKAEFAYAPGKVGTDVQLFGIGYSEKNIALTVNFKKFEGFYVVDYIVIEKEIDFSMDRKFAMLKKRKRFLFDKTLEEFKFGLNIEATSIERFEAFITRRAVSNEQDAHQQNETLAVYHLVNQFNPNLWQDYAIIEPPTKMKDYVKVSD